MWTSAKGDFFCFIPTLSSQTNYLVSVQATISDSLYERNNFNVIDYNGIIKPTILGFNFLVYNVLECEWFLTKN